MAFGFFHRNEIPKNKQIQDLPLARIHPNRFQPRHAFSSESISELAQTLREEGLLQPIIVREDGEEYEIIAGERRFRAAQSLGWEKIPAIVNNLSDQQTASLALIENLQREDLNPIDEATAYENLMELNSLTQAQLAKDIGKSQSYVANKLRLLKLDPQIQEALASGAITARHGRALLALRPYGSTEPLALLPGTVTHTLQLEQIQWENPADFYTISNFTVKITRNGQTVQYTGCEWTAIEEETRRPLIWRRATLTAKMRTEVTGDGTEG